MGQKESKYIEPYEQNVGQEEEMTENNTNVQREVDCWTDFPNEMGRIRIKRKVMDKKVNEHPENTDMEKKAGGVLTRERWGEVSRQHSKVPDVSLWRWQHREQYSRRYSQFHSVSTRTAISFSAGFHLDQYAFSHTLLHYSINMCFYPLPFYLHFNCSLNHYIKRPQTSTLGNTQFPKNQ